MDSINVLVASDDAQALRLSIHAVLTQPSLRLIGAVADSHSARALLKVMTPDVLLVDCWRSPDHGIELVSHSAQHHPCCAVLVLTQGDGDDGGGAGHHAAMALAAGAVGCLGRDASPERIAMSVLEAHVDGLRSALAMRGRLLPRWSAASATSASTAAAPTLLTARETEILRLVKKGLLFGTVSELLEISPHTVVTHLRKIYRKLAVHTRGEAVHEASQMGLL